MRLSRYLMMLLWVVLLTGCALVTKPRIQPEQRVQTEGTIQESTAKSEDLPLPPAVEPTEIMEEVPEVDEQNNQGEVNVLGNVEGRRIYVAENGTPALMPAFMHSELGCAWMGVGGQAFDINGQPILDLVVLLQGVLEETPVNLFALTGSATALGPGGFEFVLSDHPIKTDGTLYVSLYDSYGNILSGNIHFATSDQCEQNLTLINFREIIEGENKAFLPVITR